MTHNLRRLIVRTVALTKNGYRYDVTDELTGEVVAKSVSRPFCAGATALLAAGTPAHVSVTMRHEGATIDSFLPVKIEVAARDGRGSQPEHLRPAALAEGEEDDAAGEPGPA